MRNDIFRSLRTHKYHTHTHSHSHTLPDDGGSISQNVTENIMVQDMVNAENSMNTTESTNTNIFKIIKLETMQLVISFYVVQQTLFNGLLPNKFLHTLMSIKIACISPRPFLRHQRKFLHGAVGNGWVKQQNDLFDKIRGQELLAGGDKRCDSMGHSAKYG